MATEDDLSRIKAELRRIGCRVAPINPDPAAFEADLSEPHNYLLRAAAYAYQRGDYTRSASLTQFAAGEWLTELAKSKECTEHHYLACHRFVNEMHRIAHDAQAIHRHYRDNREAMEHEVCQGLLRRREALRVVSEDLLRRREANSG